MTTFFTFSAFALENVSEPQIRQTIQIKDGQIKGVVSSISFKAWSGGCTDREHFALEVEVRESEQIVTVKRNVKDVCEGAPSLMNIELQTNKLEVSDVAGKPIKIANPLAVTFTFDE